MSEYIVTVKTEVSIMADSETEATEDAVSYVEGIMCMGETDVLDVHRVPEATELSDERRP